MWVVIMIVINKKWCFPSFI